MRTGTRPPFAAIVAIVVAITSGSAAKPAPRPAADAPARTDNAVIHVVRTGHGRPMILIPGLTCSGAVWDGAVKRFADRYECHVVTLGGFGGQPRYEGPFLQTARDSLLAYVSSNRLEGAVVVGHSLGGVLAMQMGIERPADFAGLVIVDALPFLGGAGDPNATETSARAAMEPIRNMIRSQTREQFQAFERMSPYVDGLVTGAEDRARVRQMGVDSDPAATADAMAETNGTDLRPRIGEIRAPMLVLGSWYGLKEFTTRERVDSLYRAQFSGAKSFRFALADTARHFIMLDSPEWTWSQMDAFLAGLPKSPGRR